MAVYDKKVTCGSVDSYVTSKTIVLALKGEVVVDVKKQTETIAKTKKGDGYMNPGGTVNEPTGYVTVTITTEVG